MSYHLIHSTDLLNDCGLLRLVTLHRIAFYATNAKFEPQHTHRNNQSIPSGSISCVWYVMDVTNTRQSLSVSGMLMRGERIFKKESNC